MTPQTTATAINTLFVAIFLPITAMSWQELTSLHNGGLMTSNIIN
jgi:hypothetical protein